MRKKCWIQQPVRGEAGIHSFGDEGIEKMRKQFCDYLVARRALHGCVSLLDAPASDVPASVVGRGSWDHLKRAVDQVVELAITVGMLEPGFGGPMEEVVKSYAYTLHGLIVLAHGSTVGDCPALAAALRERTAEVVETSINLLDALMLGASGEHGESDGEDSLPSLLGKVWGACFALQRVRAVNRAAIGRAMIMQNDTPDTRHEAAILEPCWDDGPSGLGSQDADLSQQDTQMESGWTPV